MATKQQQTLEQIEQLIQSVAESSPFSPKPVQPHPKPRKLNPQTKQGLRLALGFDTKRVPSTKLIRFYTRPRKTLGYALLQYKDHWFLLRANAMCPNKRTDPFHALLLNPLNPGLDFHTGLAQMAAATRKPNSRWSKPKQLTQPPQRPPTHVLPIAISQPNKSYKQLCLLCNQPKWHFKAAKVSYTSPFCKEHHLQFVKSLNPELLGECRVCGWTGITTLSNLNGMLPDEHSIPVCPNCYYAICGAGQFNFAPQPAHSSTTTKSTQQLIKSVKTLIKQINTKKDLNV